MITPVEEWAPITKYGTERALMHARPDLVAAGKGPAWAVVITEAVCLSGAWVGMPLVDMLAKAEQDQALQLAIVGAYRTVSSAYAILDMVVVWSKS